MSDERLLTPDQLAEKYQVPKSWAYHQTRQTGPDAIPRVRVGKYVRFPEKQVEAWIQTRSKNN
jgi:predicted DNA-binding transcriptional regulator AlpA